MYLSVFKASYWRVGAAIGSMAMAKSKGDRGQPCRVPLCSGKGADTRPASLITAEGNYRGVVPREEHWSEPKLGQSGPKILPLDAVKCLSNALWASNDSNALSPMLSAWDCMLRNSWHRIMAVDLSSIKPDWSGCIMEKITLLSLRASTFARIFMSFCRSEVDLYEPGSSGSFPDLSNRTLLACVIESRRCWESLAELRVLSSCGSVISTYCLYTSIRMPSSPGALELGNKLVAICISSIVIRVSSKSFWDSYSLTT